MKTTLRLAAMFCAIEWAIVPLAAAGLWASRDIGLADQGDFWRSMQWVTTGPVGFAGGRPVEGTQEWRMRFGRYWLPDWQFRWQCELPRTSAIVLWLPGAVLNQLFYSSSVLHLPIVSVPARAALLAASFALVLWIRGSRRPLQKVGLTVVVGLPATMLLTGRDCAAYLNTFYQETASLVFLIAFIASLVFLRRAPLSRARLFLCVAALAMLCTAKGSCLYWALLGTGCVVTVRSQGKATWRSALWGVALAGCLCVGASRFMERPHQKTINAYNSLFTNLLVLSAAPQQHLDRLGLSDGIGCVGHSAWDPVGRAYLRAHGQAIGRTALLRVLLTEPRILARSVCWAADHMGDLSLEFLGHYAYDDPRAANETVVADAYGRRLWLPSSDPLLGLWTAIQYRVLPRGTYLLAVLVLIAVLSAAGKTEVSLAGEARLVAFIAAVACILDMTVAVVGDGQWDIIKHLFLANVLCSIAFIAVAGWLTACWPGRAKDVRELT